MVISAEDNQQPGFWTHVGLQWRALFGDQIPKSALGAFFSQLATLLGSGIPIDAALVQSARVSDPELRWICARIAPSVRHGVRLSSALAPYRASLPEIVLPVLEVGEVAGTLEGASRRLEHAFSQSAALEGKFARGVFSPWYAIIGLSLYHAVYSGAVNVAQMLAGFLSCAGTLAAYYLGGRLLCRLLFRCEALHVFVDKIKLALPQMGTVARNLAIARWGRSFATLWNAGVPVSDALEVSSRSALNAYYERRLREAARQTRRGRTLSESLASVQLLPGYLLDILATGETTGNLGDSLERFATILENDAFTRASQQFMTIVAIGQILLIVAVFAAGVH